MFAAALGATGACCWLTAWMKLQGLAAGRFLLDYMFIPVGLFLVIDGTVSLFRDDLYPVTRLCRVIIAVIFITIHIQMLQAP